jgi:hypothetical protein
MPTPAYNLYPNPTQGTGTAYGAVPGVIGAPDPFGDLSKVFDALPGVNKTLGTNLQANALGIISPGSRNALNIEAAQKNYGRGFGGGPMAGLSDNDLFGNIVDYSNKLQQQAVQNYNSLIPTISKTQTVDPNLLTQIADRNATLRSAYSPVQHELNAERLFNDYLAKVHGPGGGISFGAQPYSSPTGSSANSWQSPSSINPGGGGVGVGAGGPAPANNSIFNVTGHMVGAGPVSNTDLGADWTKSDPWGTGGFPGGGEPAPGAGPYNPAEDKTYGAGNIDDILAQIYGTNGPGGFGNTGDLLASGAGDIYSELGI